MYVCAKYTHAYTCKSVYTITGRKSSRNFQNQLTKLTHCKVRIYENIYSRIIRVTLGMRTAIAAAATAMGCCAARGDDVVCGGHRTIPART
uniref:Uncharacterized protein n=1 Tax=Trichogramma kaykai TaxID=54128 RepID=A0ABD2XGN3_9HYME